MPDFHETAMTPQEHAIYFSKVLLPLFVAVVETGGALPSDKGDSLKSDNHKRSFFELLNRLEQICSYVQSTRDGSQAHPNLELMSSAALLIGSHYRGTGTVLNTEAYSWIIDQLYLTPKVNDEQHRDEGFIQIGVQYVPVLLSICRFAFGFKEAELLSIIRTRLEEQLVATLKDLSLIDDGTEFTNRSTGELRAALASLYAESHYAEMDRLLDMPPEDRAAYVQTHNNMPPMDNVWKSWDLRISLLVKIIKEPHWQDS